jgi:hypothetical protein
MLVRYYKYRSYTEQDQVRKRKEKPTFESKKRILNHYTSTSSCMVTYGCNTPLLFVSQRVGTSPGYKLCFNIFSIVYPQNIVCHSKNSLGGCLTKTKHCP